MDYSFKRCIMDEKYHIKLKNTAKILVFSHNRCLFNRFYLFFSKCAINQAIIINTSV